MTQFSYALDSLEQMAHDALKMAKAKGASDAVMNVSEGHGLSVSVRNQQPETVELMRDKGFGVTVHLGFRRGHASSSDFSQESIARTIDAALDIARYTAQDDCAALPDADLFATAKQKSRVLPLYFPWELGSEQAVSLANSMEQSGFDTSPAIDNSDGASVSTYHGQFILANSAGFTGGYPFTRHSVGVAYIARQGDQMQRDGWYSSARCQSDLTDAQVLGQYAAQRTLARLGARKISSAKVPVLFEAPLACGLLGSFVQAVSGGALYRKSSFLVDSLGKKVFSSDIEIDEDPFIEKAFGSGVFDDEGVRTQARKVVSAGRVEGYFLGSYSARKLGMKSTGNAGGAHNLRLTSKKTKPTDNFVEMLKKLNTGFLVTDVMGQGINYVNGDYSRGASGYWVENGVIQFPVEEVTIAGNLKHMFKSIQAVGADEITRGTKTSGSILVSEMALAGL